MCVPLLIAFDVHCARSYACEACAKDMTIYMQVHAYVVLQSYTGVYALCFVYRAVKRQSRTHSFGYEHYRFVCALM